MALQHQPVCGGGRWESLVQQVISFECRFEIDLWILSGEEEWTYVWQVNKIPSTKTKIAECAAGMVLVAPFHRMIEEQLEVVKKHIEAEMKKFNQLLEERKEATEFLHKALENRDQIMDFLNRMETGEEQEEETGKKKKKAEKAEEVETWLDKVKSEKTDAHSEKSNPASANDFCCCTRCLR